MVRYDVSDDARVTTRDLADTAVDAGLQAADTIGKAVASVQDTGEQLMAQGTELGENLQKIAGNFSSALNKSVSEQPITTLGMAVAAGFLLGAIWKA